MLLSNITNQIFLLVPLFCGSYCLTSMSIFFFTIACTAIIPWHTTRLSSSYWVFHHAVLHQPIALVTLLGGGVTSPCLHPKSIIVSTQYYYIMFVGTHRLFSLSQTTYSCFWVVFFNNAHIFGIFGIIELPYHSCPVLARILFFLSKWLICKSLKSFVSLACGKVLECMERLSYSIIVDLLLEFVETERIELPRWVKSNLHYSCEVLLYPWWALIACY